MSKNKNKSMSQETENPKKASGVDEVDKKKIEDTPAEVKDTQGKVDVASEGTMVRPAKSAKDADTSAKDTEQSDDISSDESDSAADEPDSSADESDMAAEESNVSSEEESEECEECEESDITDDAEDVPEEEPEDTTKQSEEDVATEDDKLSVKNSKGSEESVKNSKESEKDESDKDSDESNEVEDTEGSSEESSGIIAWFKNQMTPKGALVLSVFWIVIFIGMAMMYQPQMKGYNGTLGSGSEVPTSAGESPMNVNGQRLQLVKHFTKATITNQYGTDAAEIGIPPYFKEDTTAVWDNYTLVCQESGTEFFAQFISMQEGVASADVFDSFGEGMKTVSTDFTEVTRSENHIVFTVTMNDEKVRGRFEIVKGNRPDSFIEVTLVSSNPATKVDDVDLAKYVKLVSVPDDMKEQAEKDLEAYMNAMLESTMQNMPQAESGTPESEQEASTPESEQEASSAGEVPAVPEVTDASSAVDTPAGSAVITMPDVDQSNQTLGEGAAHIDTPASSDVQTDPPTEDPDKTE